MNVELNSKELLLISYALDSWHQKFTDVQPHLSPEGQQRGAEMLVDLIPLRMKVSQELLDRLEKAETLRKD